MTLPTPPTSPASLEDGRGSRGGVGEVGCGGVVGGGSVVGGVVGSYLEISTFVEQFTVHVVC